MKIEELSKYHLNSTIKKYLNIDTSNYIKVNLVNNNIVSVDIDNNNCNLLLGEIINDKFVFGVIVKPAFSSTLKLISKEKIPMIIGVENYKGKKSQRERKTR